MEKYKKIDQHVPEYVDEIEHFKRVYNDFLEGYNKTGGNPGFFNDSVKAKLETDYKNKIHELDLRIKAFKETVLDYVNEKTETEQLFTLVEEKALCLPGNVTAGKFKKTYSQIIDLINRLATEAGQDFHFQAWQQLELGYEIFADVRRVRYKLMALEQVRDQALRTNYKGNLKPFNERFKINPCRASVKEFLDNEWEYKGDFYRFYLEYLSRWANRNINDITSKKLINEIKKQFTEMKIPEKTAINNAVNNWKDRNTRTKK